MKSPTLGKYRDLCYSLNMNVVFYVFLYGGYLGHDLPVPLSSPPLSSGRKRSVRTRMSVKHSSVKPDR